MKNYVRPNYSLNDYESLPQRESIRSNIKQYQDYWNYWERNSTRVEEAYAYLQRLSDKYEGKIAKDFISKVKSSTKYKKCYLFRNVAKDFIKSALNKPNPCCYTYSSCLINIDNVLYYSWELNKPKPRVKEYSTYFQFIKWNKQSFYESEIIGYFIYKDRYYSGNLNYTKVNQTPLNSCCKGVTNFKNIKEVHSDLKLDLEDYLNVH